MKRLIAPFFAVATLLFLGPSAYSQHGGRPSGTPGSMSPSASGTHGDSSTARESHGSSNAMASTNPGMVLANNKNLAPKLELLTGAKSVSDLEVDAKEFKNFGQFVAAAHVSRNLNLTGGFAALMCEMTGKGPTVGGNPSTCPNTTSTTKLSLGQAIQHLDPQADAKSESKKATQQAKQDINESAS